MSIAERVTVSVLTHNRADQLAVTLDLLIAASDGAPIVVVDNGSTDHTGEVVARYHPRVVHLRLTENSGAAGRNAGVLWAPTPYVALCDDDTWWAPGSLGRAAEALDRYPDVGVVTARVLVGREERVDPVSEIMAHSPLHARGDLPGPPILGFLAGASMVRRRAFLAAGGFDPRFFLGGEEQLLAVDMASLGWSMVYLPSAIVHHHPSPSRDAVRRRVLLARNELWFTWLRRPWRSALRDTARLLQRAKTDPSVRRAAIEAARGLPWVIRERQVVPEDVEQALQAIAA
jgi:GT2 family glycosyltransferase